MVHDNLYPLEPCIHTAVDITTYIRISLTQFFHCCLIACFRVYETHHQEHCDLTLKLYFATQYRLKGLCCKVQF